MNKLIQKLEPYRRPNGSTKPICDAQQGEFSIALAPILERDGTNAILNLHAAAAAAYRIGQPAAADAILEIADAAAKAWTAGR